MPNVGPLFGPMLIGVFLNTILFGICIVQTFIYYQTYTRDAKWIRYFVLYLFILEILNTAFDIAMIYEPLVLRFGTERALKTMPIMLSADPIVTTLVSTSVEIFIAWRINMISGSKAVPGIICFLAFSAFVGAVGTTIWIPLLVDFARIQELRPTVITWLTSSALADGLIALSLSWSLYQRKTGFRYTDRKINRIIRLTVQTGAITAIFAILHVTCFCLLKNITLNFVWDFALSKLYTNSLLSTLNARAGWNHLTGPGQQTHNVLFGEQLVDIGSILAKSQRNADTQVITTGIYELEPPSKRMDSRSQHDVERGITVTTVVERMDDRSPPPMKATQ
ncbi:hypothetical protein D9615_008808 [Tricholomella constricta]|uniref:DUF6534 domain-containing protein n=1 Tax=Tricholomella constricta TaxID=117010 RepID=A0A8H5LYK5_9AGAR|nr:hypothetical protein D9615_008808 [Tricholomella constricta]